MENFVALSSVATVGQSIHIHGWAPSSSICYRKVGVGMIHFVAGTVLK